MLGVIPSEGAVNLVVPTRNAALSDPRNARHNRASAGIRVGQRSAADMPIPRPAGKIGSRQVAEPGALLPGSSRA
jgi:hypothetical protein